MSQDEALEDVKPKLNLTINFEGQHITVKVKPHMPFRKIFEAAEVRVGVVAYGVILTHGTLQKRFGKEPGRFCPPPHGTRRPHHFSTGTFRFVYDGDRLRAEGTPAELGMEENDTIDAILQQVRATVSAVNCLQMVFFFSRSVVVLSSSRRV
ncbi:hypothetical protein JVT61DRAFT_7610 [Boletus reticuloceps]|uniref:Ubiquitin-like domain-containing protein n=1 Tax=Boletus reticuloceps TaxID=495285 RepID=A0A8I2YHR0_9AGAM|nr:hypothetical protein JVT61DRAFT_7610 [Boletus reticuloceps]